MNIVHTFAIAYVLMHAFAACAAAAVQSEEAPEKLQVEARASGVIMRRHKSLDSPPEDQLPVAQIVQEPVRNSNSTFQHGTSSLLQFQHKAEVARRWSRRRRTNRGHRQTNGCTWNEELFGGKCYKKCSTFSAGRRNDYGIRMGINACGRVRCLLATEELMAGKCWKRCSIINADYPIRLAPNQCANSALNSVKTGAYNNVFIAGGKPSNEVNVEGDICHTSKICCTGFNVNSDTQKMPKDPCPYTPVR